MADNKHDAQQERQDKYFDFLITQALEDVAQKRADDLFGGFENEPEPVLSDDFYRKMDTLLHPEKKRKPNLGRIAATLIVVAGLALGCMTPPAQAFLQQLFSLLLNSYETHTKITVTEAFGQEAAETLDAAGWEYVYYPEYLPDDYTFNGFLFSGSLCIITFEKDDALINIRQQQISEPLKSGIDAEDTHAETIKILKYDALYTEKDTWKSISYHNDDYFFTLTVTDESKAELIKIAENLIRIQ